MNGSSGAARDPTSSSSTERRVKVVICVATFRRPAMLADLLQSLATLQLPDPAPELSVVVVDNDAEESAAPVLANVAAGFPWRVVTATEPERNISLARNLCVRLALDEGADWLAFIDDDEKASPAWLGELLRTQAVHDADIVTGPVILDYPAGTPEWKRVKTVLSRARHPNGSMIDVAETANALVSRKVVERAEGPFDPAFGRTGGSDSQFFLRARLDGARIVWADQAVVRETVPESRTSSDWMLRRAFRMGNSSVLVAGSVLPLWNWLPRRLASACYRALRGIVLMPLAIVQGRGAVLDALQNLCVAMGAFAGMLGIRYVEYERSHGA